MPAIDLDAVRVAKRREEEREEAVEQIRKDREAAELTERARAWDNQMNRAFKGIMSRPARHAMMKRAAAHGN